MKDPPQTLYRQLRSSIGPNDFADWFANTACVFEQPDRFVLTTPNTFHGTWIQRHYLDDLRRSGKTVLDTEPRFEFRVHPRVARAFAAESTEGTASSSSRGELSGFEFDSILVGEANRDAHAACVSACDEWDDIANGASDNSAARSRERSSTARLLYLHGDHGTGKSRLLRAVESRISAQSSLSVLALTAEAFANHYIASAERRQVDSFRDTFGAAHILIVDDVDDLAEKLGCQRCLYHILNDAEARGAQTFISARRSPFELTGFEGPLGSRLRSGFAVRMDLPTAAMKAAYVSATASSLAVEFPPEVVELVASELPGGFHELGGVIRELIAHAGEDLCLETARELLGDRLSAAKTNNDSLTMASILEITQEHYGLKSRELLARTKTRRLVRARQVGMWLARELTDLSLSQIGLHFGGRDHSTVVYSVRRAERRRRSTASESVTLEALRQEVLRRCRCGR